MMLKTWNSVGWIALCLAGCGGGHALDSQQKSQAPAVAVSKPVPGEINDYEEFTGRTTAVKSVEVRSRVTGYVDEVLFKEGDVVKAAAPLFQIDPRSFEADRERAEGEIAKAESQLQFADADLARANVLRPKGNITQEEFERTVANRAIAAAAVKSAKANASQSDLNLIYTHVIAPIAGRTSLAMVTKGNLVNANNTILTTIVSEGEMHIDFDVDELTLLAYKKLAAEATAATKAAPPGNNDARSKFSKVLIALANEPGFPHVGKIDFIDNQVDRNTGTMHVRALIEDPKNTFSAGLFVRVRVPVGEPRKGLLISERAVMSDQGQKYVWVVEGNKVAYRKIKLGGWQDGLRVVDEGLTANDQIVVSGIQQVRDGQEVQTQDVSMPVSGADPVAVKKPGNEAAPKK